MPVNTIVVQTVVTAGSSGRTALAQAQRLLAKALEPVNWRLKGETTSLAIFRDGYYAGARLLRGQPSGLCWRRYASFEGLC